jgi:DNA-binding NarL/FixJ family response regulator
MLVDDHSLFRESLGRLLLAELEFEVVADCPSANDALAALQRVEVDVILLDYDLGNEDGLGFLDSLRSTRFTGKILFVTAGMSSEEVRIAMDRGASGICLKHSSPADLLAAIRHVSAGEPWLDPKLERATVSGADQTNLAPNKKSGVPAFNAREQSVLDGIFSGLTNKEIAVKLNISESYVKAVLQQLFAKTGVRTRSRLVRIALEARFGNRNY